MYASTKGYNEIINYLTLRSNDLDQEDSNGVTILMNYLFKKDLKMCSKLLTRGANINYANKAGCTALHACIEHKIPESVGFLLKKGANPHLMDLAGLDCCDKAKSNGLALQFWQFNNCSIKHKQNLVPKYNE
jgi:uncharacterized protein